MNIRHLSHVAGAACLSRPCCRHSGRRAVREVIHTTFFRNAGLLRSAQRALLFALSLSAGVGFTGGATSLAQAPEAYFNQNLIPPDVPSDILIGETFKFKVRFKNTGNAIGYAPFIDLALDSRGADANANTQKCDGVDFVSAEMVDVIPAPLALTGTKLPAGTLTNCTTGSTATITPTHPYAGVGQVTLHAIGWQLVTIELPFGNYDPTPPGGNRPEIVVEVTAKVSDYADADVPLKICTRGGFRFGTSAAGGIPITEPPGNIVVDPTSGNDLWECQTVTPRVFMFKKEYLGPENETATGPNFVHKYKITLDIATGQTIGKPLTVKDCLPDGMAYEGGLVVTPPSFPPTEPPIGSVTIFPGNCLEVRWFQAVGVPGPDATVEFDFSVRDQYANGNEVLDDICNPVPLDNPLSVSGNWTPLDPRDTGVTVFGSSGQAHELSAKCMAIQKSVTPSSGVKPGDLLKYTLNFQISDYKTIGQIKITDQLSDGQLFPTSFPPVLTISDQFVNNTSPIPPAYYSATADPLSQIPGCPVTGATQLVFDISGALAAIPPTHPRQVAGILTGGYATTSAPAAPAIGTLVFYAQVRDDFVNTQSPGDKYVDKHDPLCNYVKIQGTVYKNEPDAKTVPSPVSPPPPPVAEDGSASKISIASDLLKKSVYAVKRGSQFVCAGGGMSSAYCPPDALPDVHPLDQVTFRIEYSIPSSDAENVEIRNWLPLPIFDVSDHDGDGTINTGINFGWTFTNAPCGVIFTSGNACLGPTDTLSAWVNSNFSPAPSLVTVDQSSNSLTFDYKTFNDTANTPRKIDLLITLTVTNKPFADGLFLTSEAQECEQNTFGVPFCQAAIAQVKVREPKLSIRKGVIATDNPNGWFTQATMPASMVAKAPGSTIFSLAGVSGAAPLVTSAGGPNPIGILFHSDLLNVDANDLATFAVVIENQGGHPAFNVHLDDFIPWDKSTGLATCFEIIFSTLTIKDGSGATVAAPAGFSGANLGILFTSQIPALDASTMNSGANIIVITFQVKLLSNTKLKSGCCDNSAKVTQYTSTADPNAPNFVDAGIGDPLEDTAKVCVGPRAYAKCIQATSEAHTVPQQAGQGGQVPAAIGEIVSFRLITVIPEGITQGFQIQDALPVGLTYVPNSARAIFAADNLVTNSWNIPTISSPSGGQCPGVPAATAVPINLPLGPTTITNNDNNDSNLEFLIIEFNAQVDNIAANQNGTVLPNGFVVKYTDAPTGMTVTSTSGTVNVSIVEPKVTLTKAASPTSVVQGGTVTYTVTINNPGGIGGSTATAFDVVFNDTLPAGFTAGSVTFLLPLPAGCTGGIAGLNVSVTCASIPVNGVRTIKYQAKANPPTCPATLPNQATATWTSLPGLKGTGSVTVGSSGANNGERNGTTLPVLLNDYLATGSAAVNCVPLTFDLVISKLYDHPLGLTYPDGVKFDFTADCSDPNHPSTSHIIKTGTIISTHASGGNKVPLSSIPLGWTCTVTEMVPTGTDAHGCYWAPGIAVTPNPVTIQTPPSPNGVMWKNNYVCPAINPNFDLSLTKTKLATGSSGPSRGFVITVQNVGNNSLSAADLTHLKVTDNLPAGSMVTSYGNTNMAHWTCSAPQAPTPVMCSYVGPITSLAPFAALPQLQIIATPGTGNTQYIDPVTGTITNTNLKLNCVVISLKGTGPPNHDDMIPYNNVYCTSM